MKPEINELEIARDRFNINISTDNNKLHHPYIVFYFDDKVYYLTVKTLTKRNKETVSRSKDFNVYSIFIISFYLVIS
ncbi:hypothetical protein mmcaprivi_05230 [Mycoplasma mycoides]|nr:hypothetical protein mmcaprivi_05230 [Mycoplasma mycoides]